MASNRPVAVTCADVDGGMVTVFGLVGAGTIAAAKGVVISGELGAIRLTGESSARLPEGPEGGLSGAASSQPQRASSFSNCEIQSFLLIAA